MLRLLIWLVLAGTCLGMVGLAAPARAQGAIAARIQQIRIEGSQRIEPETIRSYLTLKVGDNFDATEIDKSLKTLFATGLFADVTIGRDGGDLVVRVVENPIINRIAFEGNKKLEDKTLLDEVQLRPRVVYTRTKVQTDVKRILDLYRRNGRFAATVDPKVIQLPQNRVDLVFEINEGPRTGISRITFIGNKQFSDGTLRGAIQTVETRWWRFLTSDDTYDPDRVTYDRELLRRFYLKNGYADFKVLSAVAELAPDQGSFYLTFTIDEGERYKFGKIDVSTTLKNLDVSVLKEQLTTAEGDWYDAEKVDDTIKKLTDQVGNLGYAFVEVEAVVKRDREKRTIGLTYEIREGPKVYVERIDITGNVRTLDKVIRREFRLVEGDAFNTAKLRRSQQQIRNLGFFKKVDVNNIQGSSADKTVITVNVTEQSTGELTVGAGYSSTEAVIGEVTLRERNLLGKGQDLRVSTTLSAVRQQYDLSFTEPYFMDKNIAAGLDLFHIQRNLITISDYEFATTGIRPRMGYQLTEHLRQTLSYTLRNDEVYNVQPGASQFIVDEAGNYTTSMVSQDLTYDQLDNRIEPTGGYFLSIGTDYAGVGGQVEYARLRPRMSYYFPIAAPDYVFAVRAEGGYVKGLGPDYGYIPTQKVRISDRFFPGSGNFPGFALGGVGPRDPLTTNALGGNEYWVVTLEETVPLGLPKELGLTGRVFTAAGVSTDSGLPKFGVNAAGIVGPLTTDCGCIRAAAGIGFSWKSPFGPIRIDIAQPYLKQPGDKSELFRFGFGAQF
ncbi:MAG TPA: outer membrane protein assembly factor BamA [Candidatus Sulfotelmatobacter sp.]|nr:outer membrane protein assembly factor BamA [Candidatus Sulfotelmatobacter sp.]